MTATSDHPARYFWYGDSSRTRRTGWTAGPACGSISGDPFRRRAAIAWWRERGQDPTQKLIIFSDGLDIDEIEQLHAHFHGRVRLASAGARC